MDQLTPDAIERLCSMLRTSSVAARPLPLRETLERYLAWQQTRKTPKSWANDRSYLEQFFARVAVDDVHQLTSRHIHDFLLARSAEGRAPKTLNRTREVLHAFCAWLVRAEDLAVNPVSRVERAVESAPQIRFLSLDDIGAMLAAIDADRHLRAVIATLVYAGLRRGEAVWLRWEDVDLERRVLYVRRKDGWQPKTKRNRVVPISTRLAPYIEALPHRDGWVFRSPGGKQWNADNLTHRFRRKMKEIKQPWTLLDLRHTFGTQLVMKNVSLAKVSALMGNSPDICRRHYAHVATEDLRCEVEF